MPNPNGPGPRPMRLLVPIILFCVIVGGIAWSLQFMPAWRGGDKGNLPAIASGEDIVRYEWTSAVWDNERPSYSMEFEMGSEGRFDFPFQNTSAQPFEIGLRAASCNCTSVSVTMVEPALWDKYRQELAKDPLTESLPPGLDWHPLQTELTNGLTVPAGGKGLVRMSWHARKEPPARLNLNVDMWHRAGGNYQDVKLEVPAVMSDAIRFSPLQVDLGTLMAKDSGTGEFVVWSPTRANLKLTAIDAKNPLVNIQLSRLDEMAAADWTARLQKQEPSILTRLRTAYALKVTVHEQADDKYFDQGPFRLTIPLAIDGSTADVKFLPAVEGIVKGDFQIGIPEDRGRLDLKEFSSKLGTRRTLGIFTDAAVDLDYVSHDPATLKVALSKDNSFQSATRKKWVLSVEVPPNSQFGQFLEGSNIVLRINSATPRLLRIPVVGIGTQG